MNTLESLVPPLAMCKEAAALIGNKTALVWIAACLSRGHGWEVEDREIGEVIGESPMFPAPTLAEIWNELPTVWNNRFLVMLDATNRGKGHQIGYARLIDGVLDSDGDFCTQDLNPAIAALWLWFRVKGASC